MVAQTAALEAVQYTSRPQSSGGGCDSSLYQVATIKLKHLQSQLWGFVNKGVEVVREESPIIGGRKRLASKTKINTV